MTVQVNYKRNSLKKSSSNLVLFVDEKFNISSLKKLILTSEYSFISDLLKISDMKEKIITLKISSRKTISLVSLKKNLKSSDAESLGAKLYDHFTGNNIQTATINSDAISIKLKNFIGYFLHGLRLKSYIFDKYKTKKEKKNLTIDIIGKNKPSQKDQIKFLAIEEGTFLSLIHI